LRIRTIHSVEIFLPCLNEARSVNWEYWQNVSLSVESGYED